MFHPESDSLFEVDASELPAMMETPDGALLSDVTGDAFFEKAWKEQR